MVTLDMLLRVAVVTQRVPCRSREPGTCHMAEVKHRLGFKARTSHVNVLKRMAEDLLEEVTAVFISRTH